MNRSDACDAQEDGGNQRDAVLDDLQILEERWLALGFGFELQACWLNVRRGQ